MSFMVENSYLLILIACLEGRSLDHRNICCNYLLIDRFPSWQSLAKNSPWHEFHISMPLICQGFTSSFCKSSVEMKIISDGLTTTVLHGASTAAHFLLAKLEMPRKPVTFLALSHSLFSHCCNWPICTHGKLSYYHHTDIQAIIAHTAHYCHIIILPIVCMVSWALIDILLYAHSWYGIHYCHMESMEPLLIYCYTAHSMYGI